MATYLVHGFRWPRHNIRIHVIMNNLLDVAPDWIHFSPHIQQSLCNDNFATLYADGPQRSPVKVWTVEEWDEQEENEWCRGWVYVADEVRKISGSLMLTCSESDEEEPTKGANLLIEGIGKKDEKVYTGKETQGQPGLAKLRDLLAPDSALGWYVVHCGDELRDDVGETSSVEDEEETDLDYSDTESTPRETRESTPATPATVTPIQSGQKTPSGISGWATGLVGSMRSRRGGSKQGSVSGNNAPAPASSGN